MTAYNQILRYSANGQLETKGCNAICFYNQGEVTAVINGGLLIRPGQSFSISQVTPSLVDITNYTVQFDPNDPGTTGEVQDLATITTFIKTLQGEADNNNGGGGKSFNVSNGTNTNK